MLYLSDCNWEIDYHTRLGHEKSVIPVERMQMTASQFQKENKNLDPKPLIQAVMRRAMNGIGPQKVSTARYRFYCSYRIVNSRTVEERMYE